MAHAAGGGAHPPASVGFFYARFGYYSHGYLLGVWLVVASRMMRRPLVKQTRLERFGGELV